jgi:serine/threonine protein kinase
VQFYSYITGAFGNVLLATLKLKPTSRVAIKAMKKIDIIQSKHVDHIENEKKILELIVHPFIVSLLITSNFFVDGLLRIHAR